LRGALVDDRDAASTQPLDYCHLPQRLVEVQRSREHARRVVAQRGVVTGAGKRRAAQVIREVEIRIVDPDRIADVRRHPHELLAVARHDVEALLDGASQAQRRASALYAGRAFEDVRRADVKRCLVPLGVQEPRVDTAERLEECLRDRPLRWILSQLRFNCLP